MDLAAHLGMTVGQMMKQMTAREWCMWRLKYREDPWGERRADLRAASIVQMLANINRDPEKYPDAIKLEECVLKFGLDEEQEDDDEEEHGLRVDPVLIAWLKAKAKPKVRKDAN